MRKIILILLGIALLAGAFFISNKFIANKKKPKPKFEKIVKTVFIDTVKNGNIPVIITADGSLQAKNRIQLFSEVQGVLKPARKEFKNGTKYNKGENIISINSEEFFANIQAKKSSFQNAVIGIMPDIRMDYSAEFDKWQNYLNSISVNNTLPTLPDFNSDKEKYFVSGKGLITQYYDIKNLQTKLNKYRIFAPFSGILTDATVTSGSLVRPGQKLGEFINNSNFEVAVQISAQYASLLKIGNKVTVFNTDRTKKYNGKVIRLNGKVDASTQTLEAYIQVAHKDLKEGMYVKVDLHAKFIQNAYQINRKLLIDNTQLFKVKNDSILELINVKPVYFGAENVIINELKDGDIILNKLIPGAYHGMKIKTYKATK